MTDIVVAERRFRDSNSGASVTARIFAPRPSEDSSEWSCRIDIQGLAAPFDKSIFGVDSFQALELATTCFARFWNGTRLVWLFWTVRRGIAPCR